MSPEEVRRRVAKIAEMAGDDEIAHSIEDALHQDVLAAIRDNKCENPTACAAEALKTLEINFCRWCA